MRNKIVILLLMLVCVVAASAQKTKANGRKLFQEERYEEAKPIFKYLLSRTPKSAEYNYWYAACCYETADSVQGLEEMLEFAESRKVYNAPYYLGRIKADAKQYPQALECFERFFDVAKDEKRIQIADSIVAHIKELFRMMKSTEQVCVIDSVIVDMETFLSAYGCGRDAGNIYMAAEYFGNNAYEDVLTMTERGTDIYFSNICTQDSVPYKKIYHASKNGNEWSAAAPIKGFDTGGNDCYPFMSADGATFYFASDGEGSIGGYDLYVTRYDSESGRFLRPTNMGMPFNSEANDYMMVVNEIANLGWFATDRNQPEGSVCVYVFIPNATRRTYNYETLGYDTMLSLSQLGCIADTQDDADAIRKARQQLTMLMFENINDNKKGEFLFVLDDMHDYTSLSDFKSSEAREKFVQWQKLSAQFESDSLNLENMRMKYSQSSAAAKQSMKNDILTLEQRMESEQLRLDDMIKEVRAVEYESLNK